MRMRFVQIIFTATNTGYLKGGGIYMEGIGAIYLHSWLIDYSDAWDACHCVDA